MLVGDYRVVGGWGGSVRFVGDGGTHRRWVSRSSRAAVVGGLHVASLNICRLLMHNYYYICMYVYIFFVLDWREEVELKWR